MRWPPSCLWLLISCLAIAPSAGADAGRDEHPDKGSVEGPSDPARAMDRVQVTGTRIQRAMVEGSSPVRSLSRQDLQRSGLSSIGDILQQLTASGSALNTRFNSSGNFGFPPDSGGVGAGATTVDLRHLGCKRVLVLVDGVRWVSEASASGVSSCSDLNTIPLNIVERIDVLEDGASSIYGADAVGGVINIITRRDVDGGQARVYAGGFDQGDGQTYAADASYGLQRGGLSVFLALSSLEQHAVRSADRAISRFPVPGTGLLFGSIATEYGHFILRDPLTGAISDVTAPGGGNNTTLRPVGGDFLPFTDADRYNYAEDNLALTPSERDAVFLQARFAFSPAVNGYLRWLDNRRRSANQAAPEPIFLGANAGTGNPLADQITIPASQPFNPFGFDLRSTGADANLLLAARRVSEGGLRRFSQQVDTRYIAVGFEGIYEADSGPLYWDINLADSRNRAEQINTGSYNLRNIAAALGTPAQCQATPGCVPLDIFGGPGSITDAMLGFIQPVLRDRSSNDLRLFSANLTGDLFELWAGPLALAAGFERREVEGRYQPDPLTVAGDYNGVPSLPTAGEYSVNEAYAEFDLPAWASIDSQLDLNAALRYSDYSTSGNESTAKLGIRWQIGERLLLRGSVAEGLRAPSIGELFGAAARFDALLTDPCLVGPDGTGPALDCRAFGVPAGLVQSNAQIAVTTGGNPALDAERSLSQSWGLVWSPALAGESDWAERLDLEFTWYKHRIEDAIQAIDPQAQLNLCVQQGPDSPFCDDIERGAGGGISQFINRLQNFGRVVTEGADFNVHWQGPLTEWGQGRLRWSNARVFQYALFDGMGQRQPRAEGIEVDDSAIPEWSSVLQVDWRYADVELGWSVRHFSALRESCARAAALEVCDDPRSATHRLGSTTYHDFRLGWQLPWRNGLQLVLGGNNVFDKAPPACLSCALNGYDASTYDLPGRYFYVGAELRF